MVCSARRYTSSKSIPRPKVCSHKQRGKERKSLDLSMKTRCGAKVCSARHYTTSRSIPSPNVCSDKQQAEERMSWVRSMTRHCGVKICSNALNTSDRGADITKKDRMVFR